MAAVMALSRRSTIQQRRGRGSSRSFRLRFRSWTILPVVVCGSFVLLLWTVFLFRIFPHQHRMHDRLQKLEQQQQRHHPDGETPPRQEKESPHPRPHEHMEGTATDDNNDRKQQLTILIVGGSDGSGTRGVVQALGQLRVPMLMDDVATLDIHAATAGGWPPMIESSLVAKNETLVAEAWRRVDRALTRRLRRMERSFANTTVSTKVDYGFKAPVSMLLFPFFARYYNGRVKFIHVVRDGRDIAVSSNASPVQKFYDMYYGRAAAAQRRAAVQNKASVLAMDLWNDWNVQVADFCESHVNIDCLVVRAEDLLQHKYATLQRMAHFVGSPRSDDHLCCLAHRQEKDLGVSTMFASAKNTGRILPGQRQHRRLAAQRPLRNRHKVQRSSLYQKRTDDTTLEVRVRKKNHRLPSARPNHGGPSAVEPPPQLGSRFGKWKMAFQDQPEVLRLLEDHGKRGLALFGYQPARDLLRPEEEEEGDNVLPQDCDARILLSQCKQ